MATPMASTSVVMRSALVQVPQKGNFNEDMPI
jgi:hypothetical protein